MTNRDLELELKSSPNIVAKCRENRYAQNLYAALCNMEWQPTGVFPILKEELWYCSWRSSGRIVAEIRGEGDYLSWYCSGMGWGLGNGDPDGIYGYVSEGAVTDEIKQDLKTLGWHPVP